MPGGAEDFLMGFSVLYGRTGIRHPLHIEPVRWWQVWRYPLLFRRDYILAQANAIITIELCSKAVREEVDREVMDILETDID